MDGGTDGQTDGWTDGRTQQRLSALPSGRIKIGCTHLPYLVTCFQMLDAAGVCELGMGVCLCHHFEKEHLNKEFHLWLFHAYLRKILLIY